MSIVEDYPSSFSYSPSASPGCAHSRLRYDVFISFRGPDTRDSFVSHLSDALRKSGIEAFIDRELGRGKEIWVGLSDAIERSRISVVVFSENYAFSSWCLDEVAKIVECRRSRGQIVLPVFYRVEPRDVRRQKGNYESAFKMHQKASKEPEMAEKIKRWRDALSEVASLFGFRSHVVRSESELLDDIVKHVLEKLESLSSHGDEGLIGVDSQVKAVEELLGNGSDDVRSVGIWGMGGIGKTAIAAAVFNRKHRQFESCCFIGNVSERSKTTEGLTSLRNGLLCKILAQPDINIATPDIGSSILRGHLRRKRVLVVLDDVNSISHLRFFPGPSCFGPGSRLIITTRDRDVIKNEDAIYSVEELSETDALQLFCHCAFKQTDPPEDYLELSKRVVFYAYGNPGAIRSLGLFLGKKTKREWASALGRHRKSLDKGIYDMLRVSYDGLNDEEQKIFLDVACFFRGKKRSFITDILNGCGISAEIGIRALIDKSMITFPGGRLQIHDFFEQMARKIVLEESPLDPSRCSRLCNYEEVHEVLTGNKGAETTEGISLDLSEGRKMQLGPRVFTRMRNLRILKFRTKQSGGENCKIRLLKGLQSLPRNLRWLDWDNFPLRTLPMDFQPENLVELCMRNSRLERLWEGEKHLYNLKGIDLSHSIYLKEMPNLSNAPRLERIIARGCTGLVWIPTPRNKLQSLELVDLSGCSNLKEFPEIARYAR